MVELHRVSARTSSHSTLFVVLEGQDPAGLRSAVDALVPALRALGPPWVGSVEDGVQDALAFLRPRAGLYTDLETLKKLSATTSRPATPTRSASRADCSSAWTRRPRRPSSPSG